MVSIPHPPPPTTAEAGEVVLGLDIGGTKLAAGVVGVDGRLHSLVRTPTPASSGDWRPAMDALLALGADAIDRAGLDPSRLSSIGVGSGGPLDSERGLILRPPNLPDWDGVPVTDLVEARFGRPTVLENDANAAAIATYRWGVWAGTANLVYLTISTGIGGGVVIDGRLLRSRSANVAEFGHTVVDWQGRRCDCGQRGCAEAYVSGRSIARRAVEAVRTGSSSTLSSLETITAADVATAAVAGDPLAIAIWADTTTIIGALVTSVLNVFEPSVVVIGGGVASAGSILIDPVRDHALTYALSPAGRQAAVVRTEHGDAIGVLGAAAAALSDRHLEVQR